VTGGDLHNIKDFSLDSGEVENHAFRAHHSRTVMMDEELLTLPVANVSRADLARLQVLSTQIL
jgi:hypothetical protein